MSVLSPPSERGPAAWQLAANTASCTTSRGLAGRVDLLRPQYGVRFELAGGAVHVLGVELEDSLAAETLADGYERVADLVATYLPTASRPHRVQVYWHRPADTPAGVQGLIDLQVLTQTDLLDSDPRRNTLTELPGGDVRQFSASGEQPVMVSETASALHDPRWSGILVRPSAAAWSYLEMAHPLDFHATELQRRGDRLHLRQALFVNFLEKGVILRSRVRGAIVDRAGDVETGRELYRQLCETAPPLAT